jgi:hypothetical protein
METRCNGCLKAPYELSEYTELALYEGHPNALAAVQNEEGTYNPENGHFWCTLCYIKAEQPLGVAA